MERLLNTGNLAPEAADAMIENVSGTLNLLEAARQAGHDRFVMTSSTSVMTSLR